MEMTNSSAIISAKEFESNQFKILKLLQSIQKTQTHISNEQKIKQIINYVNQFIQHNIQIRVTKDLCMSFAKQFGHGRTYIEKELIGIIEMIVEQGLDQFFIEEFKYFNIFEETCLTQKIQDIFYEQFLNDTRQNKKFQYSEYTIKLATIIVFIYSYYQDDNQRLFQCRKVLNSHIKILVKNIIRITNDQQKKKKRKNQIEKDKILEKEMKEAIKLLKSIEQIAIYEEYVNYFVVRKTHEIISPLLHINCPINVHCNKSINIIQSSTNLDLSLCVIRVISLIIQDNETAKQYLLNNHDIINHIVQQIISFSQQTSNYSLPSTIQLNMHSSQILLSDHLPVSILNIDESIDLFINFLYYNSILLQQVTKIDQIILLLIALSKYNRQKNDDKTNNELSKRIRLNSLINILLIWLIIDNQLKMKIITELLFARQMIEIFGIGGGNQEDCIFFNEIALLIFNNIFYQIKTGTEKCPRLNEMEKIVEEQTESGGGYEEFEAYLFKIFDEDEQTFEELPDQTQRIIINTKDVPSIFFWA